MSTESILRDAEFMLWAFGQDVSQFYPIDVIPLWNERHGDKLTIKPDGKMTDDSRAMVQLYLDEINNDTSSTS